jgi:hypothetical protein
MTISMSHEALLSINEPLNDGELSLIETFSIADNQVADDNVC